MAQAKAAELRWSAGKPLSALDGVPVTIKENIYTKGDPAPIGTAANAGMPPPVETRRRRRAAANPAA